MPRWLKPIKGSRCPECFSEIVYDGTYSCSAECGWYLPDPTRKREDKHAFNVAYTLLMAERGEQPDVRELERWKGEIA